MATNELPSEERKLTSEVPDWREGLVAPEQQVADSPALKRGRELQEELDNYLHKLATASPDELQLAALRFRAAAEALRAEHELPSATMNAENFPAETDAGLKNGEEIHIGSASVVILGQGALKFEFHKNLNLSEVLNECYEYAKAHLKLPFAYVGELCGKYGDYKFSADEYAEVRAFDADAMPGTKSQQHIRLWGEGMLLCSPEVAVAAAALYFCATGNPILSGYGRTNDIVIGHSSDGVFSSYAACGDGRDRLGCFGCAYDRYYR